MGYNTTLLVLNDALNHIEQDTKFGQKVAAAIRRLSVDCKNVNIESGYSNAATAIENHHADLFKAIVVGGNMAIDLGYCGMGKSLTKEKFLKGLAKEMGYRVTKIKSK